MLGENAEEGVQQQRSSQFGRPKASKRNNRRRNLAGSKTNGFLKNGSSAIIPVGRCTSIAEGITAPALANLQIGGLPGSSPVFSQQVASLQLAQIKAQLTLTQMSNAFAMGNLTGNASIQNGAPFFMAKPLSPTAAAISLLNLLKMANSMSPPLHNLYAPGSQTPPLAPLNIPKELVERDPGRVTPHLGSRLGPSEQTSSCNGGKLPSAVSQSTCAMPDQQRFVVDTDYDIESSIDFHLSRAREAVAHQTGGLLAEQDFHLSDGQKDAISSLTRMTCPSIHSSAPPGKLSDETGSSSLAFCRTPTTADPAFYLSRGSSDAPSWDRNGATEVEPSKPVTPSVGGFYPQTEHCLTSREPSPTTFTPQSAVALLRQFGLEKEDMEQLVNFAEDQITPENLPYILRQIRQQKPNNTKSMGRLRECSGELSAARLSTGTQRRTPCGRIGNSTVGAESEDGETTCGSVSASMLIAGSDRRGHSQDGREQEQHSTSRRPHLKRPHSSLTPPWRSGTTSTKPNKPLKRTHGTKTTHTEALSDSTLDVHGSHQQIADHQVVHEVEPRRSGMKLTATACAEPPRRHAHTGHSPPLRLPPTKHDMYKDLPPFAMMADYAATSPAIFPHTCSLCSHRSTDIQDWISHQNSNAHLHRCKHLRQRYPDWDGKIPEESRLIPGPSPGVRSGEPPSLLADATSARHSVSSTSHHRLDGLKRPRRSCPKEQPKRSMSKSSRSGSSKSPERRRLMSPHTDGSLHSSGRTHRWRPSSSHHLHSRSGSRERLPAMHKETSSSMERVAKKQPETSEVQSHSGLEDVVKAKINTCTVREQSPPPPSAVRTRSSPCSSFSSTYSSSKGRKDRKRLSNSQEGEKRNHLSTKGPSEHQLEVEVMKDQEPSPKAGGDDSQRRIPNWRKERPKFKFAHSLWQKFKNKKDKKDKMPQDKTPQDAKSAANGLTPGELLYQTLIPAAICYKERSCLSQKSLKSAQNVLMLTNLPVHYDGYYTEEDVGRMLKRFGFQLGEENLYVLPQRRLAFVMMPSKEAAQEVLEECQRTPLCFKGCQLSLCVVAGGILMEAYPFYKSLMKTVHFTVADCGVKIVYVKNISQKEMLWLRTQVVKIGSLRNFLPLLNKVYIEFKDSRAVDQLAVWYSRLAPPPPFQIMRMKTPASGPSPPKRSTKTGRPSRSQSVQSRPPSWDAPPGSLSPFWITLTTQPFVFPTVCPHFHHPEYLTITGPRDITRACSRLPSGPCVVMVTGLPETDYTQADVARMAWPYFTEQDLYSLYYHVLVLALQRRAFLFFSKWEKCRQFLSASLADPTSIHGSQPTLHLLLPHMEPQYSEELMYTWLMDWSETPVVAPESLAPRLLVVQISFFNLDVIKQVLQAVTAIAPIAGFLPLANRICIEMVEPEGVNQVLEQGRGHTPSNTTQHLDRRVIQGFHSARSLKKHLRDSGGHVITLDNQHASLYSHSNVGFSGLSTAHGLVTVPTAGLSQVSKVRQGDGEMDKSDKVRDKGRTPEEPVVKLPRPSEDVLRDVAAALCKRRKTKQKKNEALAFVEDKFTSEGRRVNMDDFVTVDEVWEEGEDERRHSRPAPVSFRLKCIPSKEDMTHQGLLPQSDYMIPSESTTATPQSPIRVREDGQNTAPQGEDNMPAKAEEDKRSNEMNVKEDTGRILSSVGEKDIFDSVEDEVVDQETSTTARYSSKRTEGKECISKRTHTSQRVERPAGMRQLSCRHSQHRNSDRRSKEDEDSSTRQWDEEVASNQRLDAEDMLEDNTPATEATRGTGQTVCGALKMRDNNWTGWDKCDLEDERVDISETCRVSKEENKEEEGPLYEVVNPVEDNQAQDNNMDWMRGQVELCPRSHAVTSDDGNGVAEQVVEDKSARHADVTTREEGYLDNVAQDSSASSTETDRETAELKPVTLEEVSGGEREAGMQKLEPRLLGTRDQSVESFRAETAEDAGKEEEEVSRLRGQDRSRSGQPGDEDAVSALIPAAPSRSTLPPFTPNTPLGLEFLLPKHGFFCTVCRQFYVSESVSEELHCSSQSHYSNLEKHFQELIQR